MSNNGKALAAIAVGVTFAWSGLMNRQITATIQDIVTGKRPVPGPPSNVFTSASGSAFIAGGSVTGNAIASDALSHNGQPYLWNGHPGQDWTQPVDCSSFANGVIGLDMGMTIPGFPAGSYKGTTHGPNTLAWLASIGTVVSHIPRSALQAGDIACWQTHMGIAISNSQMISAQDPENGTSVSGIDGFIPGEVLVCLRLRALASGNPTITRKR
jgi:cell wall-associated NlpC family hydrolase